MVAWPTAAGAKFQRATGDLWVSLFISFIWATGDLWVSLYSLFEVLSRCRAEHREIVPARAAFDSICPISWDKIDGVVAPSHGLSSARLPQADRRTVL